MSRCFGIGTGEKSLISEGKSMRFRGDGTICGVSIAPRLIICLAKISLNGGLPLFGTAELQGVLGLGLMICRCYLLLCVLKGAEQTTEAHGH
jgi:hypothetical protein